MIFSLEEEADDGHNSPEEGEQTQREEVYLPLKEPVEEPKLIPRSKRLVNGIDAAYSFAALRPSSLPAPSFIRPPITQQPPVPEIQLLPAPRDRKGKGRATQGRKSVSPPVDDDWQPHETEILKLVGADMPSHRGAWGKDSEAWRIFGRRQVNRNQSGTDSPTIVEEPEDQEDEDREDSDAPEEGMRTNQTGRSVD